MNSPADRKLSWAMSPAQTLTLLLCTGLLFAFMFAAQFIALGNQRESLVNQERMLERQAEQVALVTAVGECILAELEEHRVSSRLHDEANAGHHHFPYAPDARPPARYEEEEACREFLTNPAAPLPPKLDPQTLLTPTSDVSRETSPAPSPSETP